MSNWLKQIGARLATESANRSEQEPVAEIESEEPRARSGGGDVDSSATARVVKRVGRVEAKKPKKQRVERAAETAAIEVAKEQLEILRSEILDTQTLFAKVQAEEKEACARRETGLRRDVQASLQIPASKFTFAKSSVQLPETYTVPKALVHWEGEELVVKRTTTSAEWPEPAKWPEP